VIIGLAIVSADGFIAALNRDMTALLHQEDFKRFQAELSVPKSICVIGRTSHELHPNDRHRTRRILSGSGAVQAAAYETCFADSASLLTKIADNKNQRILVLGGATIYQLFGAQKLYDEFLLSVRQDVRLGNGLSLGKDPALGIDETMQVWGLTLSTNSPCPSDPKLEFRSYKKLAKVVNL
jgi:dihydrofolate reductase